MQEHVHMHAERFTVSFKGHWVLTDRMMKCKQLHIALYDLFYLFGNQDKGKGVLVWGTFLCFLSLCVTYRPINLFAQLIKSQNNRSLDAYYMPAPVKSDGDHHLSPPPQPLTPSSVSPSSVYFICVDTCVFICVCVHVCVHSLAFPLHNWFPVISSCFLILWQKEPEAGWRVPRRCVDVLVKPLISALSVPTLTLQRCDWHLSKSANWYPKELSGPVSFTLLFLLHRPLCHFLLWSRKTVRRECCHSHLPDLQLCPSPSDASPFFFFFLALMHIAVIFWDS